MTDEAQRPEITALTDEARKRISAVAWDLIDLHPEATATRTPGQIIGCRLCRDIAAVMSLLDMDQRRYGPPFEETLTVALSPIEEIVSGDDCEETR